MYSQYKDSNQRSLFQRVSQRDISDTQSTNFSQAFPSQDFSQPLHGETHRSSPIRGSSTARWSLGSAAESTRYSLPPSASHISGGRMAPSIVTAGLVAPPIVIGSQLSATPPLAGGANTSSQEPSQDSGVVQLGAAAAPRTKSELLERRIDTERRQRQQLERDVRQALTHVAAHVTALPDTWRHICGRLEEGAGAQARRSDQQMAELSQRVGARIDRLDTSIGAVTGHSHKVVSEISESAVKLSESAASLSAHKDAIQSTVQNMETEVVKQSEQLCSTAASLQDSQLTAVGRLEAAAAQMSSAAVELPQQLGQLFRRMTSQLTETLLGSLRSRRLLTSPPLASRVPSSSPVAAVLPQPAPSRVSVASLPPRAIASSSLQPPAPPISTSAAVSSAQVPVAPVSSVRTVSSVPPALNATAARQYVDTNHAPPFQQADFGRLSMDGSTPAVPADHQRYRYSADVAGSHAPAAAKQQLSRHPAAGFYATADGSSNTVLVASYQRNCPQIGPKQCLAETFVNTDGYDQSACRAMNSDDKFYQGNATIGCGLDDDGHAEQLAVSAPVAASEAPALSASYPWDSCQPMVNGSILEDHGSSFTELPRCSVEGSQRQLRQAEASDRFTRVSRNRTEQRRSLRTCRQVSSESDVDGFSPRARCRQPVRQTVKVRESTAKRDSKASIEVPVSRGRTTNSFVNTTTTTRRSSNGGRPVSYVQHSRRYDENCSTYTKKKVAGHKRHTAESIVSTSASPPPRRCRPKCSWNNPAGSPSFRVAASNRRPAVASSTMKRVAAPTAAAKARGRNRRPRYVDTPPSVVTRQQRDRSLLTSTGQVTPPRATASVSGCSPESDAVSIRQLTGAIRRSDVGNVYDFNWETPAPIRPLQRIGNRLPKTPLYDPDDMCTPLIRSVSRSILSSRSCTQRHLRRQRR